MNHIEEQINDCVAGVQSLIYKIEEIGRAYRLTPAERKFVVATRKVIDEVHAERRKNQELYEEYGITGLPLEPREATPE